MQKVAFATQSYKHESSPISAQSCINAYAEAQPQDAKSPITVTGVPGIVDFATCGAGPVRGMHDFSGTVYAVSGGFLYRVDDDGTATAVGGQISGTDNVVMDDNGTQLGIVNGTNGYIYSADSGFQLITSANFHAANSITQSDGFFLFDRSGTNEFFLSDSLDGLSYSDFFASADWQSDNLLAVLNFLERVLAMGTKTIETWTITGAANFPYQRLKGAGIGRGLIGARAYATDRLRLALLASDKIAYMLSGSGQNAISTKAIEQAWQTYSTLEDVIVTQYTFGGHLFFYFTFPRQGATWGFDATTGLWHERVSWDQNNNSIGRWRGNCAVEAYGKVLIGDSLSGKIGYLSPSAFTEFGNTIRMELTSPPLHGGGDLVGMTKFFLDCETGVGLSTGQGSDPQMMLSYSDDGGKTYSNEEQWASMGTQGEYNKRLIWDRLGSFYQRNMRVACSDPVRRKIIAAWAEFD